MSEEAIRPARGLTRRSLLQGALAAGAAFGVSALGVSPAAAAGLTVTRMKVLAGTQAGVQYGIGATDLGIPARTPDGRLLFMFGDTWADTVGGTNWRSPVALYSSTTDLTTGVVFNGAAGAGANTQVTAPQLWYYPHDAYYETVIPSDVITIGSRMYLHAIVNGPTFGAVRWTELWQSDDSGATWQHTGLKFPADMANGHFQCITWGQGNDGYVYIYGTGFQRDKGIVLYRVPQNSMTTLSAYQPWGYANGAWGWGNPATEVLPGKFGEMCLRPLGGKWILTWFNADAYRIDAMIVNTPTDNLYTAAKTTLLWGGNWGAEDAIHVAQLYGGYILPGSTLPDLHLSVSQWNTGDNSVYHVEQFRIQGLV
ncbi:DUF4185 domain-containing protein [Microbacterium sp. 22303]|uniref:DUF4185 domain-containing protein n=1 Tax=Microbacterium sp. 22303 TaxID=3453905 RepID=UPI003F871C7A